MVPWHVVHQIVYYRGIYCLGIHQNKYYVCYPRVQAAFSAEEKRATGAAAGLASHSRQKHQQRHEGGSEGYQKRVGQNLTCIKEYYYCTNMQFYAELYKYIYV